MLMEAIVAGDYLYIDGGEITTWDGQDGSQITVKGTAYYLKSLPQSADSLGLSVRKTIPFPLI